MTDLAAHSTLDAESLAWPFPERHRRELTLIRAAEGSSRSSVSDELRIRKSTVSGDVSALIEAGLIREGDSRTTTPGRPRVPLEIDPDRRHVVGLSIDPGRVAYGRVNLLGEPVSELAMEPAADAEGLIAAAVRGVERYVDDATLAIGLVVPGFIDAEAGDVLFSSAFPEAGRVSLAPIRAVARGRPVVMDSRTNSLGTRWLLQRPDAADDDSLLISLCDGQFGATLMIEGRPMRGCVLGANELGHMRLCIDTPRCYCGQIGCVERVLSTPYLQGLDPGAGTLADALATGEPAEPVERITALSAMALANAVNFSRVGRVTLMSDMTGVEPFLDHLAERVTELLLRELRGRVSFECAVNDPPHVAVAAAAPALAELFLSARRVASA